MRKIYALRRMALETLPVLAAALLIPLAASAAPAPPTVASDMCDYASNKPVQLQIELTSVFTVLGFTGLPPDDCDKFVKDLVKSCTQLVTNGTECTLNINATVGEMSRLDCDAQPDKADRSSCKQSVKQDLTSDQATARQTVQQLGVIACKKSFAEAMDEICREGVMPPL